MLLYARERDVRQARGKVLLRDIKDCLIYSYALGFIDSNCECDSKRKLGSRISSFITLYKVALNRKDQDSVLQQAREIRSRVVIESYEDSKQQFTNVGAFKLYDIYNRSNATINDPLLYLEVLGNYNPRTYIERK